MTVPADEFAPEWRAVAGFVVECEFRLVVDADFADRAQTELVEIRSFIFFLFGCLGVDRLSLDPLTEC